LPTFKQICHLQQLLVKKASLKREVSTKDYFRSTEILKIQRKINEFLFAAEYNFKFDWNSL